MFRGFALVLCVSILLAFSGAHLASAANWYVTGLGMPTATASAWPRGSLPAGRSSATPARADQPRRLNCKNKSRPAARNRLYVGGRNDDNPHEHDERRRHAGHAERRAWHGY